MTFASDSRDSNGKPPTHTPESRRLDAKGPLWLFAAALGIAVSAVSAARDHHDRQALETLLQPTAVGDPAWWKTTPAPEGVLRFDGATLRMATGEAESFADRKMRAVALTDDGRFRLYVPEERANGMDETGGPSWFLKTAPNQFLRVTR
jgi:hypothetical protein